MYYSAPCHLEEADHRIQAALSRLRAYRPPPTQYFNVPASRRAAVLILLFADRQGDLRVVLTMRSAAMKNYAGHAALPGGKADSATETPWETARREAYEEIGLPLSDAKLPWPWRVEELCQLPTNLARTELGVRPCVAYLAKDLTRPTGQLGPAGITTGTAGEALIPRLQANEVAAVFTAGFHNFLSAEYEREPGPGIEAAGFPAKWYEGEWTDWHESRWRMHNFYVPVKGPGAQVVASTPTEPSSNAQAGLDLRSLSRFRVFGMTARILVDAARVAYDEEPAFEHNSHFGDEEMIARLLHMGRLSAERKPGEQGLTRQVLTQAAKM
ncbi:NUDIX hydrolase domain-like protein [Phyllosticta citricarpa]|uniref:NUDIX hydrolase domain-like protein n=1 Tax=Phyllosticta citricarpa TaxID=55181 RepID=A0ABR1MBZ6_9PEZI